MNEMKTYPEILYWDRNREFSFDSGLKITYFFSVMNTKPYLYPRTIE